MPVEITRFTPADAASLAALIRRCLLEVNTRDYPAEEMQRIAGGYTQEAIAALAKSSHLYTARLQGEVVGCGAVSPHESEAGTAFIHAVFTRPDKQGAGIGHAVMRALEMDSLCQNSRRWLLHASYTALPFYTHLGWLPAGYKADGVVPLQKINPGK